MTPQYLASLLLRSGLERPEKTFMSWLETGFVILASSVCDLVTSPLPPAAQPRYLENVRHKLAIFCIKLFASTSVSIEFASKLIPFLLKL